MESCSARNFRGIMDPSSWRIGHFLKLAEREYGAKKMAMVLGKKRLSVIQVFPWIPVVSRIPGMSCLCLLVVCLSDVYGSLL